MPGGLCCASSTSVSLIILSASSSVGFPPTFSSRDADSVQRLVQSSEFAFRRNGQLFVVLQSQPRVFSLSVIALTSPLSFDFARWFTTADNSVFTFVSVRTRHRLSRRPQSRWLSRPCWWSSPARETRSASSRALPGVVVTCSATMFVGRPVFCHVSVLRHCA